MTVLTIACAAVGALCFGGWLLLRGLRLETAGRAKAEEKNENLGKTLDDIKKAHLARERIKSDPEYAKRVRDKYERD